MRSSSRKSWSPTAKPASSGPTWSSGLPRTKNQETGDKAPKSATDRSKLPRCRGALLVPVSWYLLLELRHRRLGVVGEAEDLGEAEDVEDVLDLGRGGGEDEVAVVLHRGVERADEAAEAGRGDVFALLQVHDDLVDLLVEDGFDRGLDLGEVGPVERAVDAELVDAGRELGRVDLDVVHSAVGHRSSYFFFARAALCAWRPPPATSVSTASRRASFLNGFRRNSARPS